MKLIKSILLFGLLTLITTASAQNRKINLQENLPFEKVLEQAKKENKLIFLDFGSLTCKPCLYLKKYIFTIDSVADFVNKRFISVDYNVGSEKQRLSKIYGVDSEPVLLILDKKGKLMHRMVGKCSSDELIARFKQGLDVNNNLVAQELRYNKGDRSTDFLLNYLETLLIAKYPDKMNLVVREVLSGPLENLKEKNIWQLFVRYNDNPVSREMIYVFDNREEFSSLFGKDVVENKINRHFDAKTRYFIFGHKPPVEDSIFLKMLAYLQKTDYEKATEWLTYLVPAKYKYTDWVKMAQQVENVKSFNIVKGKEKEMYLKSMAQQLCWYSDDIVALTYALKWIDNDLLPLVKDTKTITDILGTRERLVTKITSSRQDILTPADNAFVKEN